MTEGKRLEPEPGPEVVLPGADGEDEVLVADAETALPVDAGLVRGNHSGQKGLAVETWAYVLGPLVDVEVESHPMTRSVAEIAFGMPERFPRKDVQMAAGRPLREHSHREVYMAFKDKGIVFFFEVGAGTERNRSGYVRRPEDILAA